MRRQRQDGEVSTLMHMPLAPAKDDSAFVRIAIPTCNRQICGGVEGNKQVREALFYASVWPKTLSEYIGKPSF